MATLTRQPFAPLDGARLQSLTSMKNRQNALAPATGKRKASDIDVDDFENVDPVLFSKRPKGTSPFPSKDLFKPSAFVLTKAASPPEPLAQSAPGPARPRNVITPKSPVARLNTNLARSPVSAPAGRSPTRGKRAGILSTRRRTAGPYTRVEPPQFNLSAAAPFSLDAALKGSIPSYAARSTTSAASPAPAPAPSSKALAPLEESEMKSSWFFDIHEDTPEQEMTNLLQHGTCVLDISSDEETELRARRDRAEGRDKENIPPADDVSQTSARRLARHSEDDMVIEKARVALGEMPAEEFYAAGCDAASIFLVHEDEEEGPAAESGPQPQPQPQPQEAETALLPANDFTFAPELKLEEPDEAAEADALMRGDEPACKAALLEPMEGTGESFELWESGSAKDEGDAAVEAR